MQHYKQKWGPNENSKINKMIRGLLEKSNWQYKNKYSEQSLEAAFSIYYQFMQHQTFEKQREESNVIAKEAIWIAGVTLTYNEFVRSNSTNLQDYFFTQVTIGRLAHSFNRKNTLSTCVNMIGRFFTKGLTEQTEAYFVQNPLGDPNKRRGEASLRRICLMDEDDNAFPEISYEFVVQTLDGPKTVSELKKFMQNDFSKVINQNSIPLNENHSYEEMYEHAKTLSMNSLERIAISRESMGPEELSVAVRRFHRDPYIVQYARRRANGICQLCKQPAPFIKTDGEPYLEVHHIKMLADGGADALYNVVALCPNCHRRMHYLKDLNDIKELRRIAELNGC